MVSTAPWSNYSEADYTLQQWHNACLIHLHDGPPTSKNQCKLPVKTPNGVVNKNGVYAAAAVLAGARTALQAPIAEKAQAARDLVKLYQQVGTKPPPSLFSLGHSIDTEVFLSHHGIKGQKWGIRKEIQLVGRRFHKSTKSKQSSSKKEYLDILNKNSNNKIGKKEQAQNLADSNAKFSKKWGMSEPKKDKKKGWRPTGKQIAIAGLGAAFIGTVLFATTTKTGRGLAKSLITPKGGSKINPSTFKTAVIASEASSWSGLGGGKFIRPSSFEQPSFSIPAGNVFHRISGSAESKFLGPTYSVPDLPDFNRYATAFASLEKSSAPQLYHVSFEAKKEIRVPDLTTCLDTFSKAYSETNYGHVLSKEETLKVFTNHCGQDWDNPTARSFFSKLSEQGYHAIVDYMDDDVIGDNPLVLFDTSAVGDKVSSLMGLDDIKNAGENLTEVTHRKF